jgi:hypothetical protein
VLRGPDGPDIRGAPRGAEGEGLEADYSEEASAQEGVEGRARRALLDEGKTVNEVAKAIEDVSWSYAWDVAAAYEKKAGKVFIASHGKDGAK